MLKPIVFPPLPPIKGTQSGTLGTLIFIPLRASIIPLINPIIVLTGALTTLVMPSQILLVLLFILFQTLVIAFCTAVKDVLTDVRMPDQILFSVLFIPFHTLGVVLFIRFQKFVIIYFTLLYTPLNNLLIVFAIVLLMLLIP